MNNSQTLTLSKEKYTFNILDAIEAQIEIVENPYQIPIEELFTMAARINKKRSFLFVSNVLGKHLPINPNKGLMTAALLAARFIESVKGLECSKKDELISSFTNCRAYNSEPFIPKHIHPVVIGFAETATALGHAFFDCFQSADFFHTTREELLDINPKITFEEEHSHATSHRCYIPLEMIDNEREVILVDDEMTTGKTALNIIESIHAKYPRNDYTVVSILDWRSADNKKRFVQFEKELGINIHVVSLLSGNVDVTQLQEIKDGTERNDGNERLESTVEILQLSPFFTPTCHSSKNLANKTVFIKETGRFGLVSHETNALRENIAKAASFLVQKRTGGKTLCLGTGEFMYIPMKLAAEMGSGVSFQSTTRSPIYIEDKEGYGARFGAEFPNSEDLEIKHFVYNITPGSYDELFIFFEREVEMKNLQPILTELGNFGFKSIKIVFFSKT